MTNNLRLGLPYMGSKRKIAGLILGKIMVDNPKTKYFYDLFGGCGAVSLRALQYPQIEKVVYNEIDGGVVALLRDIVNNGVTDKYYKWIDRSTFEANHDLDTWFGGLCKVIWGFGSTHDHYLFGKSIEESKRLAHEIVVNRDMVALKLLSDMFKIHIPIPTGSTITERRLEFKKIIKNIYGRFDLPQLTNIELMSKIRRFEPAERIGLLAKIKALPFNKLSIQNNSYDETVINTPIDETIIYLDPPYKNTHQYLRTVDYTELTKWIINSKYKVYISGYEFDLPLVMEIKHNSSLSDNNFKTIERLFKGGSR